MFDNLPRPQMVGAIKLWPVHSRPDMRWFIAHEGKPYYFASLNEAKLFARDKQAITDEEGLCD